MNFLRLLTAGRSWEGKASHAAQYRMRTENLLPKFVSKKNPFASSVSGMATASMPTVKSVPEIAPSGKLETKALFAGEDVVKPAAPVATNAVKPVKAVKAAKTAKAAVSAPEVTQPKLVGAVTPVAVQARKPRTNWFKMLNPLSYFPAGGARQERAGAGRGSRTTRSAVQTELSLDKVRVMRNELNDADIEIVPGRLMGMPSGASPVLVHPEQGGGAWGRLASRFLRTEQAEHAETQ